MQVDSLPSEPPTREVKMWWVGHFIFKDFPLGLFAGFGGGCGRGGSLRSGLSAARRSPEGRRPRIGVGDRGHSQEPAGSRPPHPRQVAGKGGGAGIWDHTISRPAEAPRTDWLSSVGKQGPHPPAESSSGGPRSRNRQGRPRRPASARPARERSPLGASERQPRDLQRAAAGPRRVGWIFASSLLNRSRTGPPQGPFFPLSTSTRP